MKIKTFRFIVSNSARKNTLFLNGGNEDIKLDYWDNEANRCLPVATEKEIDDTVNDFMRTNIVDKVIDIKINDFTVHRHNNAGSDTVERTYTIMYE